MSDRLFFFSDRQIYRFLLVGKSEGAIPSSRSSKSLPPEKKNSYVTHLDTYPRGEQGRFLLIPEKSAKRGVGKQRIAQEQ